MKESVDRQFAGVREQFADVNQEFASVKEQFANVDRQFADVREQFAEAAQQRAEMKSHLEIKIEAVDDKVRLVYDAALTTRMMRGLIDGPSRPRR